MLTFFLTGILSSTGLCVATYLLLQKRVLGEQLTLDDAKGYLLISSVLISFVVSAACFYTGQTLGYGANDDTATLMALSILLDVIAALMALIVGLQRMREPEHY